MDDRSAIISRALDGRPSITFIMTVKRKVECPVNDLDPQPTMLPRNFEWARSPKPTHEHGWLRKFAGEWRNESMATMGRNIRLLHLRHPQNWGEQDTELGRARHRNRPLDYAIRVRSQRAQEDPRLGDSNCYQSKALETMGIEQHSEIALGGRRDQRVTIVDDFNRKLC